MTHYDNGTERGEYRKSYLKVFDDDRNTLSIVTETEDGTVLYNFLPPSEARKRNSRRVGALLYPARPPG